MRTHLKNLIKKTTQFESKKHFKISRRNPQIILFIKQRKKITKKFYIIRTVWTQLTNKIVSCCDYKPIETLITSEVSKFLRVKKTFREESWFVKLKGAGIVITSAEPL